MYGSGGTGLSNGSTTAGREDETRDVRHHSEQLTAMPEQAGISTHTYLEFHEQLQETIIAPLQMVSLSWALLSAEMLVRAPGESACCVSLLSGQDRNSCLY